MRKVSVIGLGYVGLPVAVSFGKKMSVVGFDISSHRIEELKQGFDRTNEVEAADLSACDIVYTDKIEDLKQADFHIVCVPTPVTEAKAPDLFPILSASRTVGKVLKRGDIVVYESTVYPGLTEEECVPVLEKESGLKFGVDFTVGYSPERINPGDKVHKFETITKVVSGSNEQTLQIVADMYSMVVTAGVHKAPSIKAAEAAKVIENTQRDINIALMNELSVIFHKLGIDTKDVLDAAGTKWNFLKFSPGLVGGHCIGVDPYYLVHKAEQVGYHAQVILAGRRINDCMGEEIATQLLNEVIQQKRDLKNLKVNVLGFTFKENVPDLRNTKVVDMINHLESCGVEVSIHDPWVDDAELTHEYGKKNTPYDSLPKADAVILAVSHEQFLKQGWDVVKNIAKDEYAIVFDIKSTLPRDSKPEGYKLWRL